MTFLKKLSMLKVICSFNYAPFFPKLSQHFCDFFLNCSWSDEVWIFCIRICKFRGAKSACTGFSLYTYIYFKFYHNAWFASFYLHRLECHFKIYSKYWWKPTKRPKSIVTKVWKLNFHSVFSFSTWMLFSNISACCSVQVVVYACIYVVTKLVCFRCSGLGNSLIKSN